MGTGRGFDMFCVRREDSNEWLVIQPDDISVDSSETPQNWPLHEAVAYVNQNRAENYPVAVYRLDEESDRQSVPHQVYPSEEIPSVCLK